MKVYVLVRGEEQIEVLPGREDKRDKLIRAGYEWVNQSEFEGKKAKVNDAPEQRKVKPSEESGGELPD